MATRVFNVLKFQTKTRSISALFVKANKCIPVVVKHWSTCTSCGNIRTQTTVYGCATVRRQYSTDASEINEFRFIPLSRQTLIQRLVQEKHALDEEEKKQFEKFAVGLDFAIVNRHYGLLSELKSLYEPINPDVDTLSTRRYNRNQLLDNEFWLLQKLSTILEKANYRELPKLILDEALNEHPIGGGVLTNPHVDGYDVLRCWVIGKVAPPQQSSRSVYQSVIRALQFWKTSDASKHFYKRVILAIRHKKDNKLTLKAFKDVASDRLDLLLPLGTTSMTMLRQRLIMASAGVSAASILGKMFANMVGLQSTNWLLAVGSGAGAACAALWIYYKNEQQRHLLDMSQTLYFQNIINNRGLLSVLVDKAEEEVFKSILITYFFLLTNQPKLLKNDEASTEEETGSSLTPVLLEQRINNWIKIQTGRQIRFDSLESINWLAELGLLTRDSQENLHVLPLRSAARFLPRGPSALAMQVEEFDLIHDNVGLEPKPEKPVADNFADQIRKRLTWLQRKF